MKTITLPTHAVRAWRLFYGPAAETSIAFVGSMAECRKFISDDNEEIYRTSHNESGRWTLKTVTTYSLSPHAKLQAEQKNEEQSWAP